MLIKNIMRKLIAVSFIATLIPFTVSTTAVAQQVNFGGFSGELTTTVTSGLSMRASDTNCRLIGGSLPDADRTALAAYTGYEAFSGNGGCNVKETDTYGNTATKVQERRNANTDDGGLNFSSGEFIDASNSVSFSFTGRNAGGVSLNLSGVGVYNPVLDLTTPAFKQLSNDAKDELESTIKLGNAYVSYPVSDTIDVTIGNYVQSQGTSALIPIGVNVVNPVNLPLLRSPGTQLKDALLPQAMIGVTAYLDGGITLDAYYQLEQKEVELDAAGSFFGSELVGVGAYTGVLSSPNYKEIAARPYAGNYHDIAECAKSASEYGDITAGCGDTGLWAGRTADGTGTATDDGFMSAYGFYNDLSANDGFALGVAAGSSAETAYDGLATTGLGAGAALLATAPGVAQLALTNAQIYTPMQTLYASSTGIESTRGTVNIVQAPQAEADDSGQFGINLSGYADNIGSGVEWALYFNNSHSNTPRLRILTIADGYATTMYGLMNATNSSSSLIGNGGDSANISNFEQYLGNTAYSATIAGVVAKALANGAYGYFNSTNGTLSYTHDPGAAWVAYNTAGAGAWALGGMVGGAAGLEAARAAVHEAAHAASIGAMATLAFTNGAKYQQYYPEDIQTLGLSLSTGFSGWATSLEVAYRPDFPFQVDLADLINNQLDSSGGTSIQSLVTYGSQTEAVQAQLQNFVGVHKWSAQPNCDISSTTGKAATVAGYVQCDGTAEFDAWSADLLAVKSFTASEPFVKNAGADSASLLFELGAVMVDGINSNQGLVATNMQSFGHDVYGGGCLDASGTGVVLSAHSNGLFGAGYCEDKSEADDLSMTYRIRGSLQYSNIANSKWGFSPSFGLNHDFHGNGPASLGGFVEDVMSMNLGATFNSAGTQIKLDYVNQLGSFDENKYQDRDYVSASISHAF